MPPRTFAVGDIHGCRVALSSLVASIAPAAEDTLVFLGDYIDRGPDAAGVIDALLQLRGCCNTVFLKGNHEEMMLDARREPGSRLAWCRYGGTQTLDSYGDGAFPGCVPDSHWEFIHAGRNFLETDTHILVHAPIRSALPVARQGSHDWRWGFEVPSESHVSGKTVVCGHATQHDGLPMFVRGTYFIDTAACHGLWLTALELGEGRAVQARDDGDVRVLAAADIRKTVLPEGR